MNRPLNRLICAGLLALIFASGCGAPIAPMPVAPTPVAPKRSARALIDVTSGLPSPEWSLTAAETEMLIQQIAALPPIDAPALFDGLGYRGFLIFLGSQTVRVQSGYVVAEDGNNVIKSYRDVDNQLEKWLLNSARPHIAPEFYDFLEEGIGK
jgi:hypothetical protein